MCSATLHARTPSEARLFNLGWTDLQELRSGTSGTRRCSSCGSPSQSPHGHDSGSDDQELDFPMLTPSVIEQEEHAFARTAVMALQQLQSGAVPAGAQVILRPSLHSQRPFGPDYSLDCTHNNNNNNKAEWCLQGSAKVSSYTDALDGGYWSSASLCSSGSSSGGSYSSISSRDGEDGVEDYLTSKSRSVELSPSSSSSTSPTSSLAARRGRPMKIKLPPRPSSFDSISPPVAEKPETMRNFDSLHRPVGVSGLTNNFAGILLRCNPDELESDFDRPLRFKSRSPNKHGFAF
ncbi:BQ2448_2549 [Microbotryum intermedium]|uniref:BQ2448_2549 protein n=1 Tax=Microbotryum intermedium TaxID=269621 RepID=A0A238F9V4_9BASI|nr:BQ2448_2549 [Microbotryum intermedium]